MKAVSSAVALFFCCFCIAGKAFGRGKISPYIKESSSRCDKQDFLDKYIDGNVTLTEDLYQKIVDNCKHTNLKCGRGARFDTTYLENPETNEYFFYVAVNFLNDERIKDCWGQALMVTSNVTRIDYFNFKGENDTSKSIFIPTVATFKYNIKFLLVPSIDRLEVTLQAPDECENSVMSHLFDYLCSPFALLSYYSPSTCLFRTCSNTIKPSSQTKKNYKSPNDCVKCVKCVFVHLGITKKQMFQSCADQPGFFARFNAASKMCRLHSNNHSEAVKATDQFVVERRCQLIVLDTPLDGTNKPDKNQNHLSFEKRIIIICLTLSVVVLSTILGFVLYLKFCRKEKTQISKSRNRNRNVDSQYLHLVGIRRIQYETPANFNMMDEVVGMGSLLKKEEEDYGNDKDRYS